MGNVLRRSQSDIHGLIRAMTLRPSGRAQSLEAELFDGVNTVTLVWLGRNHINGIEPGQELTVHGRIALRGHHEVMYNPRYELTPREPLL